MAISSVREFAWPENTTLFKISYRDTTCDRRTILRPPASGDSHDPLWCIAWFVFVHAARRDEHLDRPAALVHTLPMLTSLLGRWTIAGVAVCVLLLFFFPLVQGPFQATHGPTTAFRAQMAFLILILSIIHCALGILFQISQASGALTGGDFQTRILIVRDGMATPKSVALRC